MTPWSQRKLMVMIHHHHHIALVARISLTLSRHSSLSFIALGRSSGQHPVSSHSCWMYVRAGRPAFARPCVGVHDYYIFINLYVSLIIYIYRDIGPAVRVFANGPGDLGSIPGRVIPKDFKNGTWYHLA